MLKAFSSGWSRFPDVSRSSWAPALPSRPGRGPRDRRHNGRPSDGSAPGDAVCTLVIAGGVLFAAISKGNRVGAGRGKSGGNQRWGTFLSRVQVKCAEGCCIIIPKGTKGWKKRIYFQQILFRGPVLTGCLPLCLFWGLLEAWSFSSGRKKIFRRSQTEKGVKTCLI